MRTVPVPGWVKAAVDEWLNVARVEEGLIFRCVTHSGTVWGSGISEKVVWWVVRQCAKKAAIDKVAPHDLRRTCARLCHSAGGELEQIQFLLGHRSVETTERYLGSRQRIMHAVNDKLGIEPDARAGLRKLPQIRPFRSADLCVPGIFDPGTTSASPRGPGK